MIVVSYPPAGTADGESGTESPLTTSGDLYYYNTDNDRLPIGPSGSLLCHSGSGLPDWTQISGTRWEPSWGANSGTITNIEMKDAQYKKVGELVYLHVAADFDLSDSTAFVSFTIPSGIATFDTGVLAVGFNSCLGGPASEFSVGAVWPYSNPAQMKCYGAGGSFSAGSDRHFGATCIYMTSSGTV